MKGAFSGLLVAGAIMTTSSAAVAAPISGSVIKQAADEIAVGETVHCRRYRGRRALRSARAVRLQRKSPRILRHRVS